MSRRRIRLSEEDWIALAVALDVEAPSIRPANGRRRMKFRQQDLDIVVDFEDDREQAHDRAMKAGEPHCVMCGQWLSPMKG